MDCIHSLEEVVFAEELLVVFIHLGCCILNLRADGLMHNGRLYTNRSLVCRERSLYGRLLIAETIDIYQGYLLNVLT